MEGVGEKLRILLVSSDGALTLPVADLLRRGGHRVAVEPAPAEAASLLAAEAPDLLVLDLHDPAWAAGTWAEALTPPGEAAPPVPLEAVERAHIAAALRYTRGNKRRAAQLLGIARSTLIQKVRRYGLGPAKPAVADD